VTFDFTSAIIGALSGHGAAASTRARFTRHSAMAERRVDHDPKTFCLHRLHGGDPAMTITTNGRTFTVSTERALLALLFALSAIPRSTLEDYYQHMTRL
jgi:hypothetical protein